MWGLREVRHGGGEFSSLTAEGRGSLGLTAPQTSPQDSSRLTLLLEDTETWLYEDGEDQPKHVYVEKMDALKVRQELRLSSVTPTSVMT